jgi:hypothetical protein
VSAVECAQDEAGKGAEGNRRQCGDVPGHGCPCAWLVCTKPQLGVSERGTRGGRTRDSRRWWATSRSSAAAVSSVALAVVGVWTFAWVRAVCQEPAVFSGFAFHRQAGLRAAREGYHQWAWWGVAE